MKTLIAYYTLSGNNKKLADYIKEKYNCELLEIKEKKKRKTFSIILDLIFKKRKAKLAEYFADLNEYDNVILIGPIWMGKVCKPLLTFALNEKDNIKSFSYISVCGGANREILLEDNFTLESQITPKKVLQLAIAPLLPAEMQKDVKYIMAYKLKDEDLISYGQEIEKFFNN